jgi:hypothetical protein
MVKKMIPSKNDVIAHARELFFQESYRGGMSNVNTPEDSELMEGGFYHQAVSELMRNPESKNAEWLKESENMESSEFQFDVQEVMKSGVVISGTTGTGKSDIAMYLVDQLMKEGILAIVFDSSQDWRKRSSIPRYETLMIPHIDKIPEDSITFDISQLSVQARQNLIESFSETLYRHQAMNPSRKQFFLVFEEGSSYFREGFMRGKRFSNTAMLMSEGRNYGVRFMIITQFFASIDKMSMRYMRQRYFGSTNEPNDVEYITKFFPRERKQEIGKTLRSLDAGSFLYMNGSETKRIHIEPYEDTIQKQRIASSEPQTLPNIEPRAHSENTSIIIARLLVIGFFAILMLKVFK